MNEEPGFVAGVLRDLAASTAAILAAWGALGGATNALTTRMRLRDALRHILLGAVNHTDLNVLRFITLLVAADQRQTRQHHCGGGP